MIVYNENLIKMTNDNNHANKTQRKNIHKVTTQCNVKRSGRKNKSKITKSNKEFLRTLGLKI